MTSDQAHTAKFADGTSRAQRRYEHTLTATMVTQSVLGMVVHWYPPALFVLLRGGWAWVQANRIM